MKTILIGGIALALVAGCGGKRKEEGKEPPVTQPAGSGSAGSGSAGSATVEAPKVDEKLVARGEYLASLLGCPFCHMPMGANGPDFARAWAGGMEVPEKFGTWRAPNITQSKSTGIGNWTDEQIIASIREGKRPDGSGLYPIMPYMNYNRMTDDDAKALVAFLRTIKPIENQVAPNKDLKLPMLDAPKPANLPDPVDDPLKHGEYLVTLMHCNMCHTPMTPQGPDMKRMFAGGFELEMPMLGKGTLYGPNITSDPETGIGKWSEEDIAKSIKTMTRPDGTIIQGPMQFYLTGWSQMKDEDLKAIAKFVKSIPPIKNKVPKSTFKPHHSLVPPGGGSGAAPAGGSGAAPGGGSAAAGSAAASGSAQGSGSAK